MGVASDTVASESSTASSSHEVLRPGYRRTDIGVIPEEWEVDTLASVTPRGMQHAIVDGPFGSNLKRIHYRTSGIPIITSGYVTEGTFNADVYLYVDEDKFKQEKRSAVSPGDIVMAKIGARCGACAILPDWHATGILSGNALKITVDETRHSTVFVWQLLWSRYSRGSIEAWKSVGAQPAISMPGLKKELFPFPPLPEQRAIAAALSDVDELIGALDKLIAKKRAIKLATMQQLLTGKTRLSGYGNESNGTENSAIPGGWQEKPLSSISQMYGRIGWQGLKQSEFTTNSGDPFLITGVDFKDTEIDWDAAYHVSKQRYDVAPQIQLRSNDVLMTKDGTIGKILYVDDIPYPGMATLNSHLLVFRPINDAYVPRFLFYQMLSRRFLDHIEEHKSGSTFFGLSQAATGRFLVLLPPLDEQREIASVLRDMDAEIAAVEQRRDKTKAIKQGMMQSLLTGRVRLVEPKTQPD